MQEMLRSPVEVGSLANYLQSLKNIPGGCLGFLPSTVLLGFSHLPSNSATSRSIGIPY